MPLALCIAYEANLAKLSTWVSEVELHRTSSRPPNPGMFTSQSEKDTVSMFYDRDLPAFMVRWRCFESTGVQEGKEKRGWNDTCEWGEMVVDGEVHKITIYDPRIDKAKAGPSIMSGIGERTKPTGPLEERIVPIELFWYQRRPLSDYLRTSGDLARRFPNWTLELTKDGQLLRVKKAISDPPTEEEMVVDLAKGGLLITAKYQYRLPAENAAVTENLQVNPEEVADVWVPALIKYTRMDVDENGKNLREYHRELQWKKNLVNVEIPREQFTVDAFREGRPARLLDPRTLSITKLEDQRPKEPEPIAAAPQRRSAVWYVVAAGLPLVLFAWFSWRRLRRGSDG